MNEEDEKCLWFYGTLPGWPWFTGRSKNDCQGFRSQERRVGCGSRNPTHQASTHALIDCWLLELARHKCVMCQLGCVYGSAAKSHRNSPVAANSNLVRSQHLERSRNGSWSTSSNTIQWRQLTSSFYNRPKCTTSLQIFHNAAETRECSLVTTNIIARQSLDLIAKIRFSFSYLMTGSLDNQVDTKSRSYKQKT